MSTTVNVYDNDVCVGRVTYNTNLDVWDGSNWTCGGVGLHKGLTQLRKSGDYVLIHGTQWQGEKSWAEVITPEQAVQEILHAENDVLFEKYPDLKVLAENTIDTD